MSWVAFIDGKKKVITYNLYTFFMSFSRSFKVILILWSKIQGDIQGTV